MEKSAIIALQEAGEAILVDLFTASNLATIHAKRVTLFHQNMVLVKQLLGNFQTLQGSWMKNAASIKAGQSLEARKYVQGRTSGPPGNSGLYGLDYTPAPSSKKKTVGKGNNRVSRKAQKEVQREKSETRKTFERIREMMNTEQNNNTTSGKGSGGANNGSGGNSDVNDSNNNSHSNSGRDNGQDSNQDSGPK
ncbi:hypothetical protein F4779DRAFT_569955 [Xylariaceae sp. FL0662B]|nr:hypothetical protein F4779DRAFT_569955 [Xylariaceae sp. FL0662B]